MISVDLLSIVVSGTFLAIAAVLDARTAHIPNWLTLPGIALGTTVTLIRCLCGYSIWPALLAAAAAAALTYLLWLARCWGGGDAKACLAVFLVAGPAFPALCFTAAFAGCLALLLAALELSRCVNPAIRQPKRPASRPLGLKLLAAYLLSTGLCLARFGGLA